MLLADYSYTHQWYTSGKCSDFQYWSQYVDHQNIDDVIKAFGGVDKLMDQNVFKLPDTRWDFLGVYKSTLLLMQQNGLSYSVDAVIRINKAAAKIILNGHMHVDFNGNVTYNDHLTSVAGIS